MKILLILIVMGSLISCSKVDELLHGKESKKMEVVYCEDLPEGCIFRSQR